MLKILLLETRTFEFGVDIDEISIKNTGIDGYYLDANIKTPVDLDRSHLLFFSPHSSHKSEFGV